MRRLLDVNVWLALTVESHPHHVAARRWYKDTTLSPGDLLFCRATELSFLRLLTRSAVMNACGVDPLTNVEAADFLESVYADPCVSCAAEPTDTRTFWLRLSRRSQSSSLVWMDAYLAALAISLDAQLVTFDRGMLEFQDSGLVVDVLVA